MIPIRDRRVRNGIVFVLIPSIYIVPSESSWIRNNAIMRLLLPLPVRPAIPIFSPPRMEKSTPLSTKGPSRYRICTLVPTMAPSVGHESGTTFAASVPALLVVLWEGMGMLREGVL